MGVTTSITVLWVLIVMIAVRAGTSPLEGRAAGKSGQGGNKQKQGYQFFHNYLLR